MQAAFEEEQMVAFCAKFDGNQQLNDSEIEDDDIYPANELTRRRPMANVHCCDEMHAAETTEL